MRARLRTHAHTHTRAYIAHTGRENVCMAENILTVRLLRLQHMQTCAYVRAGWRVSPHIPYYYAIHSTAHILRAENSCKRCILAYIPPVYRVLSHAGLWLTLRMADYRGNAYEFMGVYKGCTFPTCRGFIRRDVQTLYMRDCATLHIFSYPPVFGYSLVFGYSSVSDFTRTVRSP